MSRTNKEEDVAYLQKYRAARRANPYQDTGVCRVCGVILSELNWRLYDYVNKAMYCEFCRKKDAAARHKTYIERINFQQRARKYEITVEGLMALTTQQAGKCAICGTEESGKRNKQLSVDHDHRTDKVRGLLCTNCNRALGLLGDSLEILQAACKYLEKEDLSLSSAK